MAWSDYASLAAIGGVIFAIWWGRRKGRQRFQAAISAARADAASTAVAELTARFSNVVQVHNGGAPSLTQDERYAALLGEVRRAGLDAQTSAARIGPAPVYYDLDNDDDDRRTDWLRTLASDPDDERSSGWAARTVDRDGAVRRVADGSAVM